MPEETSVNDNVKDDKRTYGIDEIAHSDGLDSVTQKIRNTVQNFFNISSKKGLNNENGDRRKSRSGQKSTVTSKNARNSPRRSFRIDNGNTKYPMTEIENDVNDLCTGKINFHHNDEQVPKKIRHSFEEDLENHNFTSESEGLQKKNHKKENTDLHNVGSKASNEDNKAPICFVRKEEQIIVKLEVGDSKSTRRVIVKSCKTKTKEQTAGHSVCNSKQSLYVGDNSLTREDVKIRSNPKKFPENYTAAYLRIPHLQSGGIILVNKGGTNVKFSKYEPEIGKIIDQTEISKKVASNQNLLSGGEVVSGKFTDMFKVPNYYADNPITIDGISCDRQISQLHSMQNSFSETFITEKCYSGGTVVDNSTKGVCLPELFPLKTNSLYQPSSIMNFSGGGIVSSSDSESKSVEDVLESNLWIQDKSNMESDLDGVFKNVSENDVASTFPCDSNRSSDSSDKCAHESTAYGL